MPYPIPGLDPDLSEALAHVRAVVRIMQQGSAYSPQDDAAKQERLEAAVEAVLARLKHQSHPVLKELSQLARHRDLYVLTAALGATGTRNCIAASELEAYLLHGTLPQRQLATAPDG
jgi:hypothetical protein